MKRTLTYSGVFAIALATLMLEILLTRIISVMAWYHLAFFVISLAMLGMTAGAVLVFVLPGKFSAERVPLLLARWSLGFAVSIPAAVALMLSQPLMPVSDLMSFLALLLSAGVVALPFVVSGVVITLALTRSGLPPGITYGVDLCGAATGCLAVIPLLDAVDAPSAAVFCGVTAALASVFFSAAAGNNTVASLLAAVVLAGLGWGNASLVPPPMRPAYVKGEREDPNKFDYVAWNTYSRVTVEKPVRSLPMLWAASRKTPVGAYASIPWRMIEIDGAADTIMVEHGHRAERHGYLDWDLPSFAFHFRRRGPAAIIGVGGGRDIVEALRMGHRPVIGIEINDLIVDLHLDTLKEFSGLARHRDVVLVADEARGFMSRDVRRYAVIAMSLIDTWASTGAGAYALSENGLYTVEAWTTFLKRLEPDGIFTVSRWYKPSSPGETVRMTALAMEALWSMGVKKPQTHLVLLQHGEIATLLVSPTRFSAGDLYRIHKEAGRLEFNVLASPYRESGDPTVAALIRQGSRQKMWRWASSQLLDMTPPTDTRPFFFNMLKPTRWIGSGEHSVDDLDVVHVGNVQATQTLVYAILVGLLLTVATVLVPLVALRCRSRGSNGAPGRENVTGAGLDTLAAGVYFALIGFGFMYVEMGLLSRLNVLIAHPTVALSVLLGGIIFFAGAGSLLSNLVSLQRRFIALFYPHLPAFLVLATAAVMEGVLSASMSAPVGARIAVGLLLIAPPALGLGICFPLGLRLVQHLEASRDGPRNDGVAQLGPWLWGINGAFGVCAGGLALGTSMAWGIPATIVTGGACYLLLPLCTWRLAREVPGSRDASMPEQQGELR
jgi:spermidine synthase